ncbi:MAG: OB-fold nucleic acid binding domain-containing protein, partial [Chloroflexi bacterium]|nr:OB-fold nucleic acid binding domain-containing protein [Chloroflexota bacterium]
MVPAHVIEELCNGIHYLSASGLIESIESLPELKKTALYKKPEILKFLKLCTEIDGFPKHMSVHLGGLLIGDGRLSDLVPLEWSSGGDIISQYDKDDIEKLGIVKMDLLALPTITVIEDTLAEIKKNSGPEVDLAKIPDDDPDTFAMLREGKTIGVFQLESPAQREMAGRLLPEKFEDIIVSISLVRPGPLKSNMDKIYLPRRHGKEHVIYEHPRLKKALAETLGVILYQEQVLRVAHDLAGLSYAEADGFRRAMTHDRTGEEMEKMRSSFTESAVKIGVSKTTASKVFDQLAAFAAYGFCKAHAVAYSILAYQSLWLKRHYPAEFFAALLSNQPVGYYPPHVLVADAQRFGVEILQLDINKSYNRYTVENGAIRVSLAQLRGISTSTIKSILDERERGEFTSLRDFVNRTDVDRPIVENLIKAGAFDFMGNASGLLPLVPGLINAKIKGSKGTKLLIEDNGYDLLPGEYIFPVNNIKERLCSEIQLLGLNLSAHPLDFLSLDGSYTRLKDLQSLKTGKPVKIIGSVIRYQTPPTRKGNRVVYIIMEDGTGIADVTVFHDVQEKCGQFLFRESWLVVKGKIQRRGPKSLSIIAEELSVPEGNWV